MTPQQFAAHLGEQYADHKFSLDELNEECVLLPIEVVPQCFEFLRDDDATQMDYFDFSTCVDRPPDRLDLVYSMYSTLHKHRSQFKVILDRHNAAIPTISHLWENANWNEREIYDLYGVFFPGHKDLRRLMMPDDWEGHPLRKDYAHPNLVVRPD